MSYTKTTLISRPIPDSYGIGGIESALGCALDWLKTGASSALDLYGAGLKAQGGQEALAAQLKMQQDAQAAKSAPASGISTTTMLIGGAVLAGVLVFAMRRK